MNKIPNIIGCIISSPFLWTMAKTDYRGSGRETVPFFTLFLPLRHREPNRETDRYHSFRVMILTGELAGEIGYIFLTETEIEKCWRYRQKAPC